MGSVVQGAALGAAFELLFVSVADATQNIAHFNADFNRLKSTLCLIKLAVDDIENFNKILKGPQHETQSLIDRLLKGEKLIQKCSKVKWNVFKRLYYSMKLRKLEAILLMFFQINVTAFIYRESKKTLVELSNVNEKLNELAMALNRSGIGELSNMNEKLNELAAMPNTSGNCGYPPNGSLAGHEQSFQVKEGLQLEDGYVTPEISSPRGHGAITVGRITDN